MVAIKKDGIVYSLVPGDTRKCLEMGENDKAIFPNAEFRVEETADSVILYGKTISVFFEDEYGTKYPVFEDLGENIVFYFDKSAKNVTGNFDIIESICDVKEFAEFIVRCISNINKYVYVVYLTKFNCKSYWGSWSMDKHMAINTMNMFNEGTINQIESLIKNVGIDFFMHEISNEDFKLNNVRKLNQAVEVPKRALDFLKENGFSEMLSTFRMLAVDDPNEVIALVEFYEKYKKIQGIKRGIQEFESFVKYILEVKQKNSKITLHRLLPYLAAQRMYFHWPVEDKVEIPYEEARLYRDYLNLKPTDLYPPCLIAAHNIAARNNDITSNKEICDKFANIVAAWKDYEWTHDGYTIIAPTKAQDFVDEGEALHHCLATYVELVVNGGDKVLFLRNETTPNESFVTFAFDDDFNVIEAKTEFNADIEEPAVLKVLADWKKKMRDKYCA